MYNKSDFEWVQPKLKSKLAISIPNEHDFNINPRLLAEIPERIGIGYNLQNMTLALCKEDTGHACPKNGTIKLPELIQKLTQHEMHFPARFTVIHENDLWIGTLDPQPEPKSVLKKPPRRKKKPDLKRLAEEASR